MFLLIVWGVPKMEVPKTGWFIKENPLEMDDVGVPPFQETSILHLWKTEVGFTFRRYVVDVEHISPEIGPMLWRQPPLMLCIEVFYRCPVPALRSTKSWIPLTTRKARCWARQNPEMNRSNTNPTFWGGWQSQAEGTIHAAPRPGSVMSGVCRNGPNGRSVAAAVALWVYCN